MKIESAITQTTKILQGYGSDLEDVLLGKKGIDSLETNISVVSKLLGDGSVS